MSPDPDQTFPPELELALAYTVPALRPKLASALALDQRLGRIVAATTEPMLGQMRLAWWRDMFAKPPEERPKGDAVLDALGEYWNGDEAALIKLVDGWEHLIGEGSLSEQDARKFAAGREACLLAVFDVSDAKDRADYATAASRWAFSDLAANVSEESERARLVKLGLGEGAAIRGLPRNARGLAVLGALGLRSLQKGGAPLMEGRGASLAALKAAMLGR